MKLNIHALKIALLFLIVTGFMATMPATVSSAEKLVAPKAAGIESVIVTGDGNAAELTIKLTSPATYTTYKVASPLRLVIDFSQITEGTLTAPLAINKGNFKTVTAHRYDTDAGILTRLEIEIANDSEAIISTSPENAGQLKVSFPGLPEDTAISSKAAGSETTVAVDDQSAVAPPAADANFKNLTGISAANNVITLAVDGEVNDFKTFRLNKPERYVVDLVSVKTGLTTKLIQLNAAGVASARIGHYPDKIRVVLDSINGTFPEATAAKSAAGLDIKLDTKSLNENSNTKLTATRVEKKEVEQAPAVDIPVVATANQDSQPKLEKTTTSPVTTVKKSMGPATVEMIDFQVIGEVSRVAVKVNGAISAEAPVKSPGYVTLTIKNTALPKQLQRSIETRSFVSPVLRITPIAIKSKVGSDAKIRIATRVVASYDFRQEGDMMYIDFKHPEGLSGDKLVIEAAEQKLRTTQQSKVSPDEAMSAELAPTTEQAKGTVYKGRKVTLEFADADVRKIFQLLAEVSNKNFVLGDDVTGNISLKLVNVPWDQALQIILETKDLDLREDGNVLTIRKKGKFKSQADEEAEIKKAQLKNEPLFTEYFSVNYSPANSVKPQLEALLTAGIGKISSDDRTNTIIVNSVRSDIDRIREYLKKMDQPEKQVMIEARIVEATSTFSRNLGVSWGLHQQDGSASFANINAVDAGFGGLTSAPPTSGVGTSAGGSMGISFGTLASNIKLDMRLNAAASAGLVKIVSTPKVATLNNKTAKITQGQQIPYTSSTSDKVETKFIEAALSLEVTPHINANGTISMKIDAKNDSPGAGSPPPINKKQATTEMLLKDGETTVIGGIYVDSDQESDEGVPYLMDIPLLGNMFKTNTKSKTKTELLIFITPRILGNN